MNRLEEHSGTPQQAMDFGAFHDWCTEERRAEWVGGRPQPRGGETDRHQFLLGFVASLLSEWSAGHPPSDYRGLVFGPMFLMKLDRSRSARIPDLAWVARENLHRNRETYLDGPADLAVEITSQESRRRDRGEKFLEYEKNGVREYWLLDYEHRRAEFYLLNESGQYDPAPIDGERFHSTALPGLWIKPEWLWQLPHPSMTAVAKAWGRI